MVCGIGYWTSDLAHTDKHSVTTTTELYSLPRMLSLTALSNLVLCKSLFWIIQAHNFRKIGIFLNYYFFFSIASHLPVRLRFISK